MLWGLLAGVVGEFVKDWREGRQNKREVKKAVAENRIRLAQSEQTHNQEWELRVLEGRDVLLQRLSFVLLTFPMVWAGFDPESAGRYFTEALQVVPEWYVSAYVGVLAAVWGLAELRKGVRWKS